MTLTYLMQVPLWAVVYFAAGRVLRAGWLSIWLSTRRGEEDRS